MKVIFLKDLSGTARRGEVKEVSEGYASNFLIPKGFAQPVTTQLQAKLDKETKEAEVKKAKEMEKLKTLKTDLEKRVFIIKVKVGDKGQIFGSVHEKDIAKALGDKLNCDIEKNQVSIESPIRQIGEHKVKIRLGRDIIANAKVLVEAM